MFSAYPRLQGSVTVSLDKDELLPVTVLWSIHIGPGLLDRFQDI